VTEPAPDSPSSSTSGPGPSLDWPSIGLGVVVALAIVMLCDIAKIGADTNSAGLLFLGIVIGFGVGGAIASRHSRDRYLTHGAVAGAVSVAVFLVVAVAARAVNHDRIEVVSLLFTALLGTCCGMLGANVGDWRRRKREADAAGDAT
jgi:putative membrane protein (TIGR04086 family)